MSDPVDSPYHYTTGSIECIDAIRAALGDDGYEGYLQGNAIKYLWRHQHKGKPCEDLAKACWYIRKLAELHSELLDE